MVKERFIMTIRLFTLLLISITTVKIYSDDSVFKYCYEKTKAQEIMACDYFFSEHGVNSVEKFPISRSSNQWKNELINVFKSKNYDFPVGLNKELSHILISSVDSNVSLEKLSYCFFKGAVLSNVFETKQAQNFKQNLGFQLNNVLQEIHEFI